MSFASSNLEWANRTGASSAKSATGQNASPADAEATIAGVDVAIGVNLAIGRRNPTVFLAGDYELTAHRFPLKNNNWDVTLGIKVPFAYDFWSQIKQKRAEQRQGELARSELQDRVRLEVRQTAETLRWWQEEWPHRESRWKKVQALYDEAVGKPGAALSRLRARDGVLELRLAHLAAVTEHILARARFERAVGRVLPQ